MHAEARQDLVEDQQRAVRVRGVGQQSIEAGQRRHHTHVRGGRLDDHGGDALTVLGEHRLERRGVVVVDDERLGGDRRGDTRRTRERERRDARARRREETVGVPVIVAGELHQQVAPGRAARETDGRHGGFGARRHQTHAFDRTDLAEPHTVGDQSREFDLALGRSAERQPAGRGVLHRGHDLGLRVPEQRGAPRGDQVDVLVARGIRDRRALRRREEARCAADGTVGAHRRVHTAGDHGAGSGEQVVIAVGHSTLLSDARSSPGIPSRLARRTVRESQTTAPDDARRGFAQLRSQRAASVAQ